MPSFSVLTPSNCFANLIKEFQILLEAQNSPDNTVRNYMKYISDFLSWVNDIKHIDDLDHVFWSDLREYQIFLRESRNLKGNSINQRFCAIKKLYAGILEKQWNNSAIEKVKYDSFHGTVPTSQEMTVLLKSIRSLNDWIMVALMSECGLRVSEVVNVTYSDIRRQRSTLYVKPSKNHEDREVPFPNTLLQVTEHYCRGLSRMPVKEDFLFAGSGKSGHLTEVTVEHRLENYLHQLGWKDRGYTPHSLRRYYGCMQYLAHPDDLPRLSVLMGHRCVSSTMVYIKASAAFKAIDDDCARIDKRLKGISPL